MRLHTLIEPARALQPLGKPGECYVKVKPVNAVPVKNLQASGDGLNVGACVEIMGLQGCADLNNVGRLYKENRYPVEEN